MNNKKRVFWFLLIAIMVSCSNNNKKPVNLQKLKFLDGIWENITPAGIVYEEWDYRSDSIMLGKSYIVNNSDTLYFEKIVLRIKDEDICYIPSVLEQNDGKPITYKMVSDSAGIFVFENLKHDFPQRIIYINKGKDSLYARIEGVEKGVLKLEEFKMLRHQN